ncbi:rab-GTPase-TBC domain-containing protein [Amylostereum chailletii]|nr:rab-GTPase-TBC domain-containing protein [Amylostereum chailletii]
MSDDDDWSNSVSVKHTSGHVAQFSSSQFDLNDDAFADDDDNDDTRYDFSATAIRADLARNLGSAHESKQMPGSEASKVLDASVSTLDINNNGSGSLDPSDISPQQPLSPESSSHFVPISLAEDAPTVNKADEGSLTRRIPEAPDHGTGDSRDDAHPPVHRSTPEIHIDSSDSHPVPVEVPHGSPLPVPYSADIPLRSPGNDPQSSVSHRAKSTSSLPLHSAQPTSTVVQPPPLPRASSGHKPSRSSGPSIFEKVVSKTRPSFLPPKPRNEDMKHMADWERMMKQSRAAEEKRRKALQERRLARELKVEESLHIWEKEIVPNWKGVRENPALRRLWWAGIPTRLRATLWERAVGNPLALSKDTYRVCVARAKRAIAAGTFPTTTLSLLEDDVRSTLPSLHIFHPETGPMYEDLKEMLYAWVVSRSDEGLGYIRGIAKLAAMILLNTSASQGFIIMRNLLERHCLRSFYGGLGTRDDIEAYYRIFDTLLADVYFNFKQHQISPAAYLPDWFLPMFLDHLPFEACARIWDVILLEGDSFLYRTSLAILAVLEPRLFFPDRQELLDLLRGENKAALEVARRGGRQLDGAKYEIYGVDEETLWDRIDSMEEWWKESTWTRLLRRELPDL